jgi:DNA helicase-2/ATP-dependent DNA helicase PcrA
MFEEKTAAVFGEYQRRLRRNNAMDFDDLLLNPIDLFRRHSAVLESYQDRFRFILIDEYQDTNRAQYVLIKLLADRFRNICVVGDDAQSIYAFRGADIRNILDFQRDYPDARVVRLEQNYRSTKTILAAADQVIKHNQDQIAKDLWTENPEGEKITVLACEDDRDESASVVARIYEECRRLKIDLKDVAVMYRTNAQSRSLEDALNQQNVRYTMVGGVRFYERKEIKDVIAYLRVLVNPSDDDGLLRIANYPVRGLGDVAISRWREFAAARSFHLLEAAALSSEIPGLSARSRNSVASLAALFAKYRALTAEMSVSELSRAFIDEIGILRLLKEEGTPEAMTRWENVHELLSAITEYAAQQPESSLETFVQEKALLSDVDQWDDKHNAVTLMTLHAAKGLEFPVVFITGLEEGLLPFSNGSALDRKELEEERRLYYVGLTRAKDKLYLSHARVRYRFSEVSSQSPSRFLDEIDEGLLETVHSRGRFSPAGFATTAQTATKRHQRKRQEGAFYADALPDYEHETQEGITVGTLVHHEIFGPGKILHLSGTGDALKAVVEFRGAGKKNLLLKYAHLKLV